MKAAKVEGLNGGSVTLDESVLGGLKAGLRGALIFPGDEGYDKARTIWNAMIDRRPGLVIQCAGVNDVKCAVDFVRSNGLCSSVKGGGHNIAGSAVCENGVLIDLSGMRSVRIDPKAKIAHVELIPSGVANPKA